LPGGDFEIDFLQNLPVAERLADRAEGERQPLYPRRRP
jgi:hypothetical protein